MRESTANGAGEISDDDDKKKRKTIENFGKRKYKFD